ncbi:MurR/RpiR family transcriptional regulator [Lacticaseibacillus pabuli]|uniref:MurR/RpiR family transcriptional regulator n=1 Tax=Lacticaseibacillus pabuli TaxID=3025672 RepID=A0ABY7WVL0_9LACO|nr:MurR/RpiR family transcriptional regulator [Lacticaseibacillus sp. KACC 23028]WDF83094.1 MurR/RpiR family transcriptional regulator [Lacticaseibacillus sp. KACC 23028]
MAKQTNIINTLYGQLPALSVTDHKIAEQILGDPRAVVNMTIAELAQAAEVSEASISRFCRTVGLGGFHELKIALAQVAGDEHSYYHQVSGDSLQQALKSISDNKVAEVVSTLAGTDSATIQAVLDALQSASMVLCAAAGGTLPVAQDAAYKLNQLGIMATADTIWEMTVGQAMNMPRDGVVLVISNSGETQSLLSLIQVAKQRGITVIAMTNRVDSPIAQQADLHILTTVRQRVFDSEYYFSRLAATTAVEAIFLLLLAQNKSFADHIKAHETIVAPTKI